MLRTRLTHWIALAAAAAGAVAVPGIALAAQGGPAAANAGAPSRCVVSQLRLWEVSSGVAAGTAYYDVQLSNISSRSCTLYGYPGVSAVGPAGHQLGHAAGRDPAEATRLVTLGRGDTAHAIVEITSADNYPPAVCHPTDAAGLRIYPPNDFGSAVIQMPFRACRASRLVYLHVRTTVEKAGIPGFTP